MQSYYADAAKLIASFEGFISHAKWDVNAWRLGYGSDTIGAHQIPVRRGDVTTHADALANLTVRIPEFEKHIVEQVGGFWQFVPDAIKIPLLDIAYNYGHLPGNLPKIFKECARSKNYHALPEAIEKLRNDNNGINAKRRDAEAALVRKAL